MGIAILFYHYSRKLSENDFEIYANELIDEIYGEINTRTPLDFTNGLTGIGWGIEYLKINRFIEGDTDKILKEIDDILLQYINQFQNIDQSGKAKELGYDYYLKARKRKESLNLADLTSFIELELRLEELIKVQYLINSESYGLFKGIAGSALMMLNNIVKTN